MCGPANPTRQFPGSGSDQGPMSRCQLHSRRLAFYAWIEAFNQYKDPVHFAPTLTTRKLKMAKPAARLSDLNACPITGHGTNPSNSGSGDVNINGMPVLRVGDTTACGDTVTEGISNILINGKPIAFLGQCDGPRRHDNHGLWRRFCRHPGRFCTFIPDYHCS